MPKKTLRCIGGGGLVSERFMFPHSVVFHKPFLGQRLSVIKRAEDVRVEDIFSVSPIEPFYHAILLGRCFGDCTPFNLVVMQPKPEPLGHHFRAVVAPYPFRLAMLFYQAVQERGGPCGRDAMVVQDAHSLPVVVVYNVKCPKLFSIPQYVVHEIDSPFLITA